jgi:hemoglobin
MNGPSLYTERYGPIRIPSAHAHLRIGPRERDAWLRCMELAIAEQGYAPDFAAYLLRELRVPAERVRETSRDPIGSDGSADPDAAAGPTGPIDPADPGAD